MFEKIAVQPRQAAAAAYFSCTIVFASTDWLVRLSGTASALCNALCSGCCFCFCINSALHWLQLPMTNVNRHMCAGIQGQSGSAAAAVATYS